MMTTVVITVPTKIMVPLLYHFIYQTHISEGDHRHIYDRLKEDDATQFTMD